MNWIEKWLTPFIFIYIYVWTIWQLQCYLVHTHMLHKDTTSDYRLRKQFFTNRVVNIWNSLPDYVAHADTVNCFKSRLDTFWSNQDLVYNSSTPKLAEPEVEVKLYSNYYNNTLY